MHRGARRSAAHLLFKPLAFARPRRRRSSFAFPSLAEAAMPHSAAQAPARGALDWLGEEAVPAATPVWIAASEPVAQWLLEARPYLRVSQNQDGVPGLTLDEILSLGDHGWTIVHLVIDALRQEARRRSQNRSMAAPPGVPWREVLRLPGAAHFADAAVAGGGAPRQNASVPPGKSMHAGAGLSGGCRRNFHVAVVAEGQPGLAALPREEPAHASGGERQCGHGRAASCGSRERGVARRATAGRGPCMHPQVEGRGDQHRQGPQLLGKARLPGLTAAGRWYCFPSRAVRTRDLGAR